MGWRNAIQPVQGRRDGLLKLANNHKDYRPHTHRDPRMSTVISLDNYTHPAPGFYGHEFGPPPLNTGGWDAPWISRAAPWKTRVWNSGVACTLCFIAAQEPCGTFDHGLKLCFILQ